MRKILSIVAVVILSLPLWAAGKHTYVNTSVLQSGTWTKIRVSESGVCRMDSAQLQSLGIDYKQVRIFGYGGAQLAQDFQKDKIDDLPQIPVYVGNGYVLFWVQGNISWSYNGSRFVHVRNTYSDYGYYFLTDNVSTPKAFAEAEAISGEEATDVTTYLNYQVHDYDSLNLIDRAGIAGGGRTFYGEQFNANQTRTFTFSTPNAVTTEQSVAYMDVAGYANVATTFYATLDSTTTKSVYIRAYPDHYTKACSGTISNLKATSKAGKQTINIRYESELASAFGWLNSIELTTPSYLRMTGDYMPIRSTVNYKSMDETPVRFNLTGADAQTQIWDVTDLDNIRLIPSSFDGTTLQWVGQQKESIREYVAVNPHSSQWVKAEVVGTVSNQNLHQLKDKDLIIICPEGYDTIATRLAQAHEAKQSITWAVVKAEQVYNEFSSGTPDATAYRWLMKMLYDRANSGIGQKPRWLLLLGHGTFDNRKLLPNSGESLLLTYQAKNSENEVNAYCTDDYFAFLDDSEGESDTQGRMDIGVGRLPVRNVKEATAVVNKLITYIHNDSPGKWKNQILFLADDGEHGTHTETSEVSAERMRVKNPDFVINKVYLDAYPQEVNASGESYPLAKNRVTNLLKNGVLFFDYSGHGSYNAITNESILNIKDIENMTNRNLAFWLFATCSFSECDGGRLSCGEAAVLNPNGGAVGVFSATRTVYATPNTELNRSVSDTLFGHENVFHYDITLGEAIAIGKNKLGSDANKMAYILLGDPAIRLNYPTDYYVQTTTVMDTLNALDVQHVEGQIIDEDSLVVDDYNGKVDITVYDKLQVITTRDNDASASDAKEMQYNDYPNTIFSGSAAVKEGKFSYTFMVPKDIRYNFGNGRIVYYAVDSTQTHEAVGHFEDFVVGGTGSLYTVDTTGPDVLSLYLNHPAFKDGDKTHPTPHFYALLEDEHGINTAGAGIGHDLMLTVEDKKIPHEYSQTYILNEYFTAERDSYTKGQVSYPMSALAAGEYTLTFRAWDLLNNSSTRGISFIVDEGLEPSIYSVTTYPNPVAASGIMNIVISYDQPEESAQTELYLYNLSGQLVYQHAQAQPDQMVLNLQQIGLLPGVYVYNVRVKSMNSRYSASAGKIIITK